MTKLLNIRQVIALLSVFWVTGVMAQEIEKKDTILPAVITDVKGKQLSASERIITPVDFSMYPTAVGEGDFVKLVQTLPGIASGSDGSSNFYVRGGNMGGNLQTLDGVPIYGTSHLIGLTTAYPSEVISSSLFQVGGFTSEEGNLTSSHIKLTSKDGSFDRVTGKLNISNLLVGGSVSTPLKINKLSLLASVRVSPAPYLFKAISDRLDKEQIGIRDADAVIYDIYAKVKYRVNGSHSLSFSAFRSQDKYNFIMSSDSEDKMGWNNLLAILQYDGPWLKRGGLHVSASYNHYSNSQGMIKLLDDTNNNLMIRSLMNEGIFQATVNTGIGDKWSFQYGLKARLGQFCPGSARELKSTGLYPKTSSPFVRKEYLNFTGVIHGQAEYGSYENNKYRLAGRLNYNNVSGFVPEASALIRLHFIKQLGMEITGDYVSQFYHTLEGTPLGWSLDMIVPPTAELKPESALQAYVGFFSDIEKHHFSVGAYYKKMYNLLWYADATKLFDSAMPGWEQNIEMGSGTSKGLECMYEKTGDLLNWRISYTLSKTDRLFPKLNQRQSFPAKYDRTHILSANASARLLTRDRFRLSLSGLFTYQSGHRETVPAGSWWDNNIISGETEIEFHTTLNNYRMPAYIRMDIGALFEFTNIRFPQTLNIGVYNVMNRHNPFSLTYNPDTKQWNQISLLPVMPSLKYSIQF